MADDEQISILRQGAEHWNAWRSRNPEVMPRLAGGDLSGLSLRGADLANAHLSRTSLRGADLSEAMLYQAEFYKADLSDAILDDADLRGAKLHCANCVRTRLRFANLFRVDFILTNLAAADLTSAYLNTTAFSQVDLSRCVGLDEVIHGGPSSVDIHTILRSGTTLPRHFLTGTGVPGDILERIYATVSTQETKAPQSCFISYGHEDEDFARALHEKLRAAGVRCWFAPEDMRAGQKIIEQLDAAIRRHDRLIVVLSEHSLHSQWVATEVLKARARESSEGPRVLFPLRLVPFDVLQAWHLLDSNSGKDVASEVREYFIPDFSAWRDAATFESAINRLLRDLRQGRSD